MFIKKLSILDNDLMYTPKMQLRRAICLMHFVMNKKQTHTTEKYISCRVTISLTNFSKTLDKSFLIVFAVYVYEQPFMNIIIEKLCIFICIFLNFLSYRQR